MPSPITFVTELPFPKRIGVDALADAVGLPDDATLHNHVGTVHAGALFTLGECASGVAVMRDLPAIFGAAMIVAKNASIAFKRPARGKLEAHGALVERAESILGRLASDGKVTFDVAVSIKDTEGTEVATLTVAWYARKG